MNAGDEIRRSLRTVLPRLHAYARTLSRNDSDAHDLVQDTVIRAMAFDAHYAPGTNLYAWLKTILYRLFVMQRRKAQAEHRGARRLLADPCSFVNADGPPAMLRLTQSVATAVSELPEHHRGVIELVDLMDHSYGDAATTLGVAEGTVMSRLHRARRALAARLDPEVKPLGPPAPAKGGPSPNPSGKTKRSETILGEDKGSDATADRGAAHLVRRLKRNEAATADDCARLTNWWEFPRAFDADIDAAIEAHIDLEQPTATEVMQGNPWDRVEAILLERKRERTHERSEVDHG
jgi:RNA polymerase sigma-70 factor, ECF subfamily